MSKAPQKPDLTVDPPVKMTFNLWVVQEIIEGQKRLFYFTDADRPVTYNSTQYIPLSDFDLARKLNVREIIKE